MKLKDFILSDDQSLKNETYVDLYIILHDDIPVMTFTCVPTDLPSHLEKVLEGIELEEYKSAFMADELLRVGYNKYVDVVDDNLNKIITTLMDGEFRPTKENKQPVSRYLKEDVNE